LWSIQVRYRDAHVQGEASDEQQCAARSFQTISSQVEELSSPQTKIGEGRQWFCDSS
jgi:hypothetical protein